MALGTPVAGAAAYSAQNGTSVSPAYPAGILATDAVLLFVGQKPSTANGGTVTTPTGWTLREELTGAGGYGTTLGADTGNTNLLVYSWNTPVAGQTGTLAVTLGVNNVTWAFMVRIPTGGGALSYGSADGQRTTAATSPLSVALANGATATNFQSGDLAIWAMCIPTDVTTPSQFSAQSITATGATFAAAVEMNEPDSSTGNDIGGYSARALVTAGSSTAAPTVTATLAGTLTNVRGPVVLLRVREAAVTTLTGNSSRTDHTSTTGAVTSQHTATGNNVRQDTTSTAAAVAQTHVLAGNSVRQDTTSTTGAVEQVVTTTLTGNSVRQDTTSTTGAVSSTHTLAGNSVRQDTTATAGTVTSAHTLAGNSVRQDTTTTTGAVSSAHTLAGNNARQDTTSTTGSVSASASIAGNSARQDTTATTGAVTQTHLLVGSSARSDAASTAGAVTSAHTVAGNSAASATSSTTGAVSATHILAGTPAQQATTSTADAALQTHLLSGAEAAQATTATTGTADQTHVLAGNSVAHETTSTSGSITQIEIANLSGQNVAQPTTSTVGAVTQVNTVTLFGASAATVAAVSAGQVTQTHRLTGDYVEPGYVASGYVLYARAVQQNLSTSGAITQGDLTITTPSAAGGGGSTGYVARARAKSRGASRKYDDEDLRALVDAKWESIEAAQQADNKRQAAEPPRPVKPAAKPAPAPVPAIAPPQAAALQAIEQPAVVVTPDQPAPAAAAAEAATEARTADARRADDLQALNVILMVS